MFSDSTNPVEVADRFEHYKAELSKSFSAPKPVPGAPGWDEQTHGGAALEKALNTPEVSKALSPDLVSSVRNALAESGIGKEWTVGTGSNGNPVAGGLVAFDLEAPAKLLTPRPTPLRNRIARRKGIGLAHRFKVISGFTGTGTGGVGIFHPGINEGGTVAGGTQFMQGGWTPLRGSKIEYAGYDKAVNYKQFSVSDTVSWAAQFSGQGYQDVRQLSQTALLYSSMLLEERMLLGGRGTDSGFSGAIVPTVTVANRAVASGESNISGASTSDYVFVQVVGNGVWGSGALTSEVHAQLGGTNTGVVDVTITNADSSGALSYDIYVGTASTTTAPGPSAMWLAAKGVTASKFTIQGALPTSGTAATAAPASDTSAHAQGYDGILSYCCGSEAGSVNHLNGKLVNDSPFQDAFVELYDSVKADPDEMLANGNDRRALSDVLKSQSSSNYEINLINAPGTEGAHNAQLGALVTGVQNQVTGKMVNVTVHPWLPQGTMPIISWTLPLPDSNVSDVFAVYNVTDYTGINWPVNQFLYESSSYWYGTFLCYAPAWCGAVMGIEKP